MISTQKKWIYGVVLVMTSALFAHELVQATATEDPPLPLDAPAEALPTELAGGGASAARGPSAGETPGEPGAADDPAQVGSAQNDATLGALERALALLDQDSARVDARSSLARARRKRSADADELDEQPQALEQADEPAPQAESSDLELRTRVAERAELEARLERFLDENPLIGIVRGPGGDCAVFGGRRVRVGERLLDGAGELLACDELGVQVELRGRALRVELGPLRTRPRSTPLEGGGASAFQPSAAARAPVPAAQPSPPAPAQGAVQ